MYHDLFDISYNMVTYSGSYHKAIQTALALIDQYVLLVDPLVIMHDSILKVTDVS